MHVPAKEIAMSALHAAQLSVWMSTGLSIRRQAVMDALSCEKEYSVSAECCLDQFLCHDSRLDQEARCDGCKLLRKKIRVSAE